MNDVQLTKLKDLSDKIDSLNDHCNRIKCMIDSDDKLDISTPTKSGIKIYDKELKSNLLQIAYNYYTSKFEEAEKLFDSIVIAIPNDLSEV